MEFLVWLGAGITLAGLAGLIWCILKIWKARSAGLDEPRMREELQRVVPLNTGALFLSVIGLMLVVIGILLG